MKKITIIGHFGFNQNLLNGQTIKTKTIAFELEKMYGCKAIKKIDTRGNVIKRFFSFVKIFFSFFNSTDIIFLSVKKGLKVLAPLLVNLNKIFKRKLHYITIGGRLYEIASRDKKILRKLNGIDCIYVETKYMEKELMQLNLHNVFVMPNCKRIEIIDEKFVKEKNDNIFKFCTFSRVAKDKGIEDAVNAINLAQAKCDGKKIILDIYGQIDSSEKEWFNRLSKSFSEAIKYCGEVPYDKSTDILSRYDALLFPTYYEGEGFAGTIIDAFAAGLPVFASNWKSNPYIITDGVTGFVFEPRFINQLEDIIITFISDTKKMVEMKIRCLEEAKKYEINFVMKILYNNILYKKEV